MHVHEVDLETRISVLRDEILRLQYSDEVFMVGDYYYEPSTGLVFESKEAHFSLFTGKPEFTERKFISNMNKMPAAKRVLDTLVASYTSIVGYEEFEGLYPMLKNRQNLFKSVRDLWKIFGKEGNSSRYIRLISRIGYMIGYGPQNPLKLREGVWIDLSTGDLYDSIGQIVDLPIGKVGKQKLKLISLTKKKKFVRYTQIEKEFNTNRKNVIQMIHDTRELIELNNSIPQILVNVGRYSGAMGISWMHVPINPVHVTRDYWFDTVTNFIYYGKEASSTTYAKDLKKSLAEVLKYFLARKGRLITYSELAKKFPYSHDVMLVFINRVNNRLRKDSSHEDTIKGIEGYGFYIDYLPKKLYRFCKDQYFDMEHDMLFYEFAPGKLNLERKLSLKQSRAMKVILDSSEFASFDQFVKGKVKKNRVALALSEVNVLVNDRSPGQPLFKNHQGKGYSLNFKPIEHILVEDDFLRISDSHFYQAGNVFCSVTINGAEYAVHDSKKQDEKIIKKFMQQDSRFLYYGELGFINGPFDKRLRTLNERMGEDMLYEVKGFGWSLGKLVHITDNRYYNPFFGTVFSCDDEFIYLGKLSKDEQKTLEYIMENQGIVTYLEIAENISGRRKYNINSVPHLLGNIMKFVQNETVEFQHIEKMFGYSALVKF